MITKEELTAVILAGGKSQRMGMDKAFMKYETLTFVERIISAVKPLVKDVILIANKATYAQFDAIVYPDLVLDKGPVGGIYTAMEMAKTPFLLVLSCDIPLISTALLRFLIQNSRVTEATVLTIGDQLQPLTAIYKRNTIDIFKDALTKEQLKLQTVLENLDLQKLPCPVTLLNDLTNINTLNDFLNILSMQIDIQYFGLLAEAIGKRNETLSIKTSCTVQELQLFIKKKYPQLEEKRFKVAVNHTLAASDVVIVPKDKVALLPPFAGG